MTDSVEQRSLSDRRRALLMALSVVLPPAASRAQAQSSGALLRNLSDSGLSSARRMALVIGNDDYLSIARLDNARNDARSVAAELAKLDFAVSQHQDLRYTSMVDEIDRFVSGLKPGDDVVFFYAGHGVQIPRVGGFLLPVDVSVGSSGRLERTAYSIEQLSAQISEAGTRFSLLLIDACRDNPFLGRSASTGFAAVEPARGQMVVFSSSKNQVAVDRLSRDDPIRNSVFTRELLRVMRRHELSIQEAMLDLQSRVERLAMSAGREQRPAIYSEVRGRFYLHPNGPQLAAVAGSVRDPDAEAWDVVRDSERIADFEDYLRQFPTGRYHVPARAHIRRLQQAARERESLAASSRAPTSPASTSQAIGQPSAPAPDPDRRNGPFVPPAN
jgi:hypothetical protein